jgi:NAD-dependent dihydropyrimidine dehydrogenase PreA subunit
MTKECCDVLGHKVGQKKKFYTGRTASGRSWVPAFIQSVDSEKCSGCGMCVKVCSQGIYKMQLVDGRGVSVAVNPGNCLGDCHCHRVCPVEGGAMLCRPREV